MGRAFVLLGALFCGGCVQLITHHLCHEELDACIEWCADHHPRSRVDHDECLDGCAEDHASCLE